MLGLSLRRRRDQGEAAFPEAVGVAILPRLTEDLQAGRRIGGLRIENPFA
jgi:hypothetical protein